ncbi:DUF6085 family protein [Streptomyces albidoflavus]|uniref:DUF6085 family protein n=1 Tax=Streptomyces albidoflavus TaxID=1886 RepID=UPI002251AF3F|nr:DUF6085 family protein [Streptomyces albidoflavus]MCX4444758.1 DUF6085 family protein [Streptomyces albidoflavus]
MTAIPLVQGRCPACGWSSLFLGVGGYITCSRIDCPTPEAASTLLEHAHVGGQWRVEFYDGGTWRPCGGPFDDYAAAVRHQQHLDAELPTWRDESVVRRRTVRCRLKEAP